MTTSAVPSPPARPLSKSSLISLILGVLLCLPVGLFAILFGIIGFVATGKPGVRGRWMAVMGTLLGAFNVFSWIVAFVLFGAAMLAAMGLGRGPEDVGRALLEDLTKGDLPQARLIAPDISEPQLMNAAEYLHHLGALGDVSLTATEHGETAALDGTASYDKGKQHVTMQLQQADGNWKVVDIEVRPM